MSQELRTRAAGKNRPAKKTPEPEAVRSPESLGALIEGLKAQLLESGPPVYLADTAGRILYANAAFTEMRDAAQAAEAGAHALPGPRSDVTLIVLAGGGPVEREEAVTTASGERLFRAHHYAVPDLEGGIAGIGGRYEDITQERAIHQRAVLNVERFDDIARLVSDWIWETDRHFNFTYVSGRVSEVLEYLPREILGRNLFKFGEFVTGAGRGATAPDETSRAPFRGAQYRAAARHGEPRLFLLAGLPVFEERSGAFRGYRGSGRDITAETQARAHANLSRIRLKEAIESVSEGFGLYDAEDRLILCNSRFRHYWVGIERVLSPGTPYGSIMRAAASLVALEGVSAEEWAEEWVERRKTRPTASDGFVELELKDGRWLKVSDRPTADGGVVTVHTDISEQKRREGALTRAKESAELASQAKTEFLANVSHELRTPLNAIIGFTELMRNEIYGPLGSPRYKRYLGDVLASGNHLLEVINDILDSSKAEAGKLQLIEKWSDPAKVIEAARRILDGRAQSGALTVRARAAPGLPPLYADERKVRQVVLNLLSNAIKFTPQGGEIAISADLDGNGDMLLAVSDTGIGIAEADIPRALASFGQVDSSLSRKFPGTGLGLPLCEAIMELHGGAMTLESEPDVGTCVTCRFPAERVGTPGTRADDDEPPSLGG